MSTLLNDTMDAAKNTMETAKDGTQHAVSSARSSLLDSLHTVSSVVSIIRGFGLSDALGLVGLTRKRGPFESIALFGAGVAVGTGVGFLFAPAAGNETRRKIFGMFMDMEKNAETKAKEIGDKAEDLVGKAKDTVMDAEKKVENKVGQRIDTMKETVKGKVEAATDAVKETADNAKSAVAGSDILRQSNDVNRQGTDVNRQGNDATGNNRTTHARH